MDQLLRDLKYSVRSLRRSRGFTLVAVLTMALGIGANTAMFSVVNGVLLKPLPYADPGRLVRLWSRDLRNSQVGSDQSLVSPGDFLDWQGQTRTLSALAAFTTGGDMALTGLGDPEQIAISSVTPNLFRVLGVRPAVGRELLDQEAADQSSVIISDSLWHRRLNGDPQVRGRTLMLDGRPATIVGVMPREFNFPPTVDVWKPLALSPTRGGSFLNVVARVADGRTVSDVQKDMDQLSSALQQQFPASNAGWGITVIPFYLQEVGRDRGALFALSGVVAFVLLIACVNLANLLSARASTRRREMALRFALGASRARLIRLLFTECLVLSVLGAVVGVALAALATPLLLAVHSDALTPVRGALIDVRVLLFTVGVSITAAFLFGLAPALQLRRMDIDRPLREAGRSGARSVTQSRTSRLLVISEVALAFAVLTMAGLSIKSVLRVLAVDTGLRSANLLTLEVRPPSATYGVERIRTFYPDLLGRIERLPGVASAAATSLLPMGGDNRVYGFRPEASPAGRYAANYRVITPHYFQTMGMTTVEGRDFDSRDANGFPPVVIVNRAMMQRFWPIAPGAVGQRISIRGQVPATSIIGIVNDVRHFGPESKAEPEMYVPHAQVSLSGMTIVVRTAGDPRAVIGVIRRVVHDVDPNLPVSNIRTMDDVVATSTAPRRFSALLLFVFGAVALLLAAVGVFGVTRQAVGDRTAEIGTRIAFGAAPRQILTLIMGQQATLLMVGISVGAIGAFLAGRLISGMFFGVQPYDPFVLLGVACLLAVVALAASYLPARQTLRIDPIRALKAE